MPIPFEDVKAGDKLIANGGFDCIKTGEVLEVFQHGDWLALCVRCAVGAHRLSGDEHGLMANFSAVPESYIKQKVVF